ncbi:MAG: glycosyl transferase family 1 [Pseudomonadota bacterium]
MQRALTRPSQRRRVAYFAHDWGDAAVHRRVAGFQRDGFEVLGFAMSRGRTERPPWVVADLGTTRDNAYLQRLAAIMRGARRARAAGHDLGAVDVVVARNLDMLASAAAALGKGARGTPLVYECLDIHRMMVREDAVGRAMRALEGRLLRRCAAVWLSSPAFEREYFARRHASCPTVQLVENRMAARPDDPARRGAAPDGADGRLRIGWFGNLRCARSLALLEALGQRFPDRVEIVLRGYPALGEIPDFDARVAAAPAIRYGGRYRAPDDLGDLYGGVDVVWAGDFMDAGLNSAWLLPNRLYEGGWFGCPPIAPAAAETGRWVAGRGAGFVLEEPLEETLPALVARLLEDRSPIDAARAALVALDEATFVEEEGSLAALIDAARSPTAAGARPEAPANPG